MRIACACFGLTIVFSTAIGQAALPPCAADQRVREATDVIQIEVSQVAVPVGYETMDQATCTVTGHVVRVFRGAMTKGASVVVPVTCHSTAAGGGVIYAPDGLKEAKVLELHMLRNRPIQAGPGIVRLDAPTDEIAWTPNCN